jgi:hypothetical protein
MRVKKQAFSQNQNLTRTVKFGLHKFMLVRGIERFLR